MVKNVEVPTNIREILNKASEEVGKQKAAQFDMQTWLEIQESCVTSPIEQALIIGLRTVQALNDIKEMGPVEVCDTPKKLIIMDLEGFQITPQFKVGKFKVDFAVCYRRFIRDEVSNLTERIVLIECDSQEFHDRSETERRYEKQRDRFLQTEGYKVFRYTGAEILKDTFGIAAEIIAYVTNSELENIQKESFVE